MFLVTKFKKIKDKKFIWRKNKIIKIKKKIRATDMTKIWNFSFRFTMEGAEIHI